MAALVAAKELSAVELAEAHLEQIARLNPKLNAFIDLRPEAVLAEARAGETNVTNGDQLGPLHGVPISIKSCIDVAGMKCEAGSKLRVVVRILTTDGPTLSTRSAKSGRLAADAADAADTTGGANGRHASTTAAAKNLRSGRIVISKSAEGGIYLVG